MLALSGWYLFITADFSICNGLFDWREVWELLQGQGFPYDTLLEVVFSQSNVYFVCRDVSNYLNNPDLNYIYIILSPSFREYNFKFVGDLDL